MSRRNLYWLVLIAAVSLVCYHKTPSRYGRTLADALDHVSRRYYVPVKESELFQGAMDGMIEKLNNEKDNDDRNSKYFPPAEAKQFLEDMSGQFIGVGIIITLDPKTKRLMVLSPVTGTPAYEAGIQAGDSILKIDGQSTQGMSVSDASERVRGAPDTRVVLTVLHEGQQQPEDIAVTRRMVQVESVRGDTPNADPNNPWNFFLAGKDRIGYIRLIGFADGDEVEDGKKRNKTVLQLERALRQLTEQGMRGLVLDLRDNPGGSLAAAVGVCKLFIKPGVIVTTRGRDRRVLREEAAREEGPFTDFPMAVLVNGGSASASEIVAACLQDHHRAVIVGQRTYGKGTVQEVREMGGDYGTLKLTIATFWRPSNKDIHRHRREDKHADDEKNGEWGVKPDDGCQVLVSDEERIRFLRWRQERDIMRPGGKPAGPGDGGKPFVDRPRAKAVEWLEKSIGK